MIHGALALAFAVLLAGPAAQASENVLRPIDPRQVKVGGEIGRRIDITIEKNLLAIDVERDFLAPFRKKDSGGGYIGIGKLIESFARFAYYTGDERLAERKRELAGALIATQEADGYIGMMKPDARMWGLWDISEAAYIILGLSVDHRLFKDEASLRAARRLADWIIDRWTKQPDGVPGGGTITTHMAVVGLENALLALHAETGEKKYLDACIALRRLPEWGPPIVLGRWGKIEGHAYAYLAACIAQLRLYCIAPQPGLLSASRRASDFLRTGDGLVITGTCGDHECWHDTQEGTINLGETCATAYLIRFWQEWFLRMPIVSLADPMERAIYNALFAAQSPDGRRLRYYTPFDGPRSYFEGDSYCCPNNYRRIIAEISGMIYYRNDGGVLVNLYTPSELKIEAEGGASVTIRQETDYPSSGRVTIHVEPDSAATLQIVARVPGWCTGAKATVKDWVFEEKPGGWLAYRQEWKPGDRIDIEFPMPIRLVKGRKAQAGRVAVMRGPLVYCLSRARNPDLAGIDLRNIVIDPATLQGPEPDDSVRPGGTACRVRAWKPGAWYPLAAHDLSLILTEYPDPTGEAIYFKVPDPNAKGFVDE